MPSSGSIPTTGGGGGFGPLAWIIGVLIIVVCFGGGIWYFFNHTGGRHQLVSADDLNPHPFPPKGMSDGSSQFGKVIPDGSNQFHKGWDQFGKVTPSEKDPGPGGDAANQFDKDFPNQIGGDGGLTGNEIGGSGSDQLDKI